MHTIPREGIGSWAAMAGAFGSQIDLQSPINGVPPQEPSRLIEVFNLKLLIKTLQNTLLFPFYPSVSIMHDSMLKSRCSLIDWQNLQWRRPSMKKAPMRSEVRYSRIGFLPNLNFNRPSTGARIQFPSTSIIIRNFMFQNSPQLTDFVEVFDAKVAKGKSKVSYKTSSANCASRVYDNKLKSYMLQVQAGSAGKLVIPKDEGQGLFLIQQYLILLVQPQQNFSMQLYVSDTNKTKRRVIVSQSCQKPESKLFFLRIPSGVLSSEWSYISIDLWSFMTAFAGQNYRALEHIYLGGNFKLKRILTSKYNIGSPEQPSSVSLPKQYQLPSQVEYTFKSYWYSQFFSQIETIASDIQSTIMDKSGVRQQSCKKNQFSTPINNPSFRVSATKNRSFVNNSEHIKNNRIQLPLITKSSNRSTTIARTPNGIETKKFNHRPPLIRRITGSAQKTPSINGRSTLVKIETKCIGKAPRNFQKMVVNEWRTNPTKIEPETTSQSKSLISKSTITTLFNKKSRNKLNPQTNQPCVPQRSIYSDSEYFEMSQKFSTITDQKFFKKQSQQGGHAKERQIDEAEESMNSQIQQDIEVQDNSNTQELKQIKQDLAKIEEEIRYETAQQKHQQLEESGGFMKLHYKQFLKQAERPYSPPFATPPERKLQKLPKAVEKTTNQLQLIYYEQLKCYYDFKTDTFYELRM